MTKKHQDRRHRVGIFAYDGLSTFEFAIAIEAFALERPELNVPWYDCRVFANEQSAVRATGFYDVTSVWSENLSLGRHNRYSGVEQY